MQSGVRLAVAAVAGLAGSAAVCPAALGAAVTYQADAAHTGNVDASFAPPLGKKWIRRDLGEKVSYPVIGEGKVFVTAARGNEIILYALDRRTGGTVWSRPVQGVQPAYANGRVFVAGSRLQSYSAATGQGQWLLEPRAHPTAPVTDENLVYVTDDSGVHSYEQLTGAPVAQSARGAGAKGGVAIEDPRLYAGPGCTVSLFSKALGEPAWTYGPACGEGAFPPAVYGGKVWARSVSGGGVAIDQLLGLKVDNFNSHGALAFAGDLGYFRGPTQIQARRVDTGTIAWTYTPAPSSSGSTSPTLAGSLLVVRGVVYGLTAGGRLVGLDRANGAELWSADLSGELGGSPYYSGSSSQTGTYDGMAADESGLLVPTGSRITALGPGGDTAGVDDPDKEPGAQTRLTASASAKSVTYPGRLSIGGEVSRSGSSSYSTADDLELQASTYPYSVWTTIARRKASSGRFSFSVRPDRNTRYRVVDIDTAPAVASKTMRVTTFMGGRARYYYAGPRAVKVSATLTAPAWLGTQRRMYFYLYSSRRDRSGTRIGSLRLRRTRAERYRARGTLRTRRLRDQDLFLACVPVKRWREIGDYRSKDRCGARRI